MSSQKFQRVNFEENGMEEEFSGRWSVLRFLLQTTTNEVFLKLILLQKKEHRAYYFQD